MSGERVSAWLNGGMAELRLTWVTGSGKVSPVLLTEADSGGGVNGLGRNNNDGKVKYDSLGDRKAMMENLPLHFFRSAH